MADSGGTFWQTFGGLQGAGDVGSKIDQLLESPDSTVDQLLEEEEIIQEFKAHNDKLLERLCQQESIRILIEYIIVEPPQGASDARCHRYPFVAAELITCEVDPFLEAFVKPENASLLDQLWGFMDLEPASEVNPVLAGYFTRAAAAIHAKHALGVVQYLQNRGTEKLLQKFLERLHSRSLAELFVRLLCAEQASQVVFPVEGLIVRILERLEADRAPSSDAQENITLMDSKENITLVLDELLGQKDALCYADELIRQLTAPAAITILVNCLFSSCAPSVSAAVSILSSVIFHTCVQPRSPYSMPTLRCPKPVGDGSDDLVNIGDGSDDLEGTRGGFDDRPSSPCVGMTNGAIGGVVTNQQLEVYGAALVDEICSHIPRIGGLLKSALVRSQPLACPIGQVQAVGATALEVVCFLTTVVKTGRSTVFEAFLKEQLLTHCLDMFFRHPWNSLLHNSVQSLLTHVLHNVGPADGASSRLVLSLLNDAKFADRAVAEFRLELADRPDEDRCPRVGYMGHLHTLCQELTDFSRVVLEVREKLAATDGWDSVVAPRLEWFRSLQAQPLGGAAPGEQDDSLSSMGMRFGATPSLSESLACGSTANPLSGDNEQNGDDSFSSSLGTSGRFTDGGLETELNMLDKRDLDEELDARRILNKAGDNSQQFDPFGQAVGQPQQSGNESWAAFDPPPRSEGSPSDGCAPAQSFNADFGADFGGGPSSGGDWANFGAMPVTDPKASGATDLWPSGDGPPAGTSMANQYDDDL